jgi:hypothetical protein
MDFIDKLLPVIIMLIWFAITFSSNKRKKKGKPQKPSLNEKKHSHTPSFFNNLQKGFEDLLQENQLSVPFPVKTTNIKPVKVTPTEKEKISRSRPEKTPEKKSVKATGDIYERTTKSEKIYYPKKRNRSINGTVSVKKLREAIIWSEILAKPLSLRDDSSIG